MWLAFFVISITEHLLLVDTEAPVMISEVLLRALIL